MRYIVLLSAFLCSCASVYVPNSRNMPAISEAGEMVLAGTAGTTGWEGQFAISPVNNFALMANGLYRDNRTSDQDTDYNKHKFWEFGAGYYDQVSDNWVFEVYGGYGQGKGMAKGDDVSLTSSSTTVEGNYSRYFIQPSMALKKEHFEAGFGFRISRMMFDEINEDNIILKDVQNTYIEPAATFRAGGDNLKFNTQLGFSMPMLEQNYDHQFFTFSVGVTLRLNLTNSGNSQSPDSYNSNRP